MNPRAASFCRVTCWLGARLPAWLRVLGLLVLLSFRAASGEPSRFGPPAAAPATAYLFTGQQFDPDLGLYYLRARYHNPDSGRFWTADAFEGFASDPASLHRYNYCQGDPVNRVDPSGYSSNGAEAATVLGLAPVVRASLFKSLGSLALGGWVGYVDAGLNGGDVGMGALVGASAGAFAPMIIPARILGSAAFRWGLTGLGAGAAGYSLYEGHPWGAAFRAALVATPWLLATQGARSMVQALTEYYSSPLLLRAARTPVSRPNYSNWGGETAETAEAAFGTSRSIAVAPAADTAALVTRAEEVHSALHPIAQQMRTTAVLETGAGRIVAGGGEDLARAQRLLLGPGETAARLPGAHAEVTALQHAMESGLAPRAIGIYGGQAGTRVICPECEAAIRASGGTLTSPTTAIWAR